MSSPTSPAWSGPDGSSEFLGVNVVTRARPAAIDMTQCPRWGRCRTRARSWGHCALRLAPYSGLVPRGTRGHAADAGRQRRPHRQHVGKRIVLGASTFSVRRKWIDIAGSVPLCKLHGSLNWYLSASGVMVLADCRPAYRSRDVSYIVAPAPEKAMPTALSSVWGEARSLLTMAEEWVVVGYSAPPYDTAIAGLLSTSDAELNLQAIAQQAGVGQGTLYRHSPPVRICSPRPTTMRSTSWSPQRRSSSPPTSPPRPWRSGSFASQSTRRSSAGSSRPSRRPSGGTSPPRASARSAQPSPPFSTQERQPAPSAPMSTPKT